MQNIPLVSVIIPVHNVEQYITDSLSSIQNQSYKNLEIIVIDDGSTDNTYSIISEIAKNDKRINIYKNEANIGIAKTLNKAIDLSKGDYILRMDGDDVSALDRVEKKLEFLTNNTEINLVGCSLTAIDTHGSEIKKIKKIGSFDLIKKTIRYSSPVSHIWMCSRSVYDRLNGYRDLSGAEDYDFLLRLISSGMKCANITDYYGYYVRLGRDGNTLSTNGIAQKKLHEFIYKMHQRRLTNSDECFSGVFKPKYMEISKTLYSYANTKLQATKINIRDKKYFFALLNFLTTLISPHMIHIYYLSLIYKIKTHGQI